MRIALAAAAVLCLTVLAGCGQAPATTSSSSTPPPPPAWTEPAQPKLSGAATVDLLTEFATQFPERHDNVPTHEGARQWIAKQWADAGLTVWRQNFTKGGLDQANVVGIRWGQVHDQVVVVGGHYDTTHWDCAVNPPATGCVGHKTSQGAYDDGSGTILSVALGKAWGNVTPYYTIAFVAYDGEERGLEGASAFVEAFESAETPFGNATFHGAIDIDMFGITWPGTMAPILVLDDSDALYDVFDGLRKDLGVPDDMVYREDAVTLGSSDFAVYFQRDVPTLFFDSDFGRFGLPAPAPAAANLPAGTYPFWHFEDTIETMTVAAGGPDNLDAGFQTAVDVTAAVLHAMADQPTFQG